MDSEVAYEFKFSHKIPYEEVRGTPRPILELKFFYQGESYIWGMLVDSGADNIVVPQALADFLGINVNALPREPANTCRNGVIAGSRIEELDFSLRAFPYKVFSNRVYFADERYEFGYGLLCRVSCN